MNFDEIEGEIQESLAQQHRAQTRRTERMTLAAWVLQGAVAHGGLPRQPWQQASLAEGSVQLADALLEAIDQPTKK